LGTGYVWREQNNIAVSRQAAEDEHLAHEAGDSPLPEVHCRDNLSSYELIRRIMQRDLRARPLDPELRPEVDLELERRLPRLRKWRRREDSANAHVEDAERLEGSGHENDRVL